MPMPKNSLFFGFADKLTEEQKIYVDSMFDNRMTIVNAVSGSGKTTLAVAVAKMLQQDLIYVFAPVQEDKMGFRPGEQEAKEKPYTIPLLDALEEIDEDPMRVMFSEEILMNPQYRKKMIDGMKNGTVWVYPKSHIFMRGSNIKDKTIIIDEAQNFTKPELKKVLTRIHDSCTVIVIGHSGQCDLDDPKQSGFESMIEHFRSKSYVKVCQLTKNFRGELAQDADMW